MRRVALVVPVIVLLGLLIRSAMILSRRQQVQPTPVSSIHPPAPTQTRVSVHPSAKHGYGKAVYAKTSDGTADGPTSVYEQDLDTGKTTTLIPNQSLPKQFKRSMGVLSVSSDGNYLVVGHRNDNPILWSDLALWSRKTGKFHELPWTEEDDSVSISPHGTYVALYSSFGRISVFDSSTNLAIKVPSFEDQVVSFGDKIVVVWSTDEGDMIIAASSSSRGSTACLVALPTPAKRVLFRRPRGIDSIAQSPTRRQYAVSDSKGVYLVDRYGRQPHKLTIKVEPIGDNSPFCEVMYDRTGSKLAVLSSLSYGEPHYQSSDQLWYYQGGVTRRVAEWDQSSLDVFSDDGSSASESLAGWSSDGKAILLIGQVQTGHGGDVQAIRNDFFIFSAYNVKDGKETDLCRSGDGCLGMTWYPGKRGTERG